MFPREFLERGKEKEGGQTARERKEGLLPPSSLSLSHSFSNPRKIGREIEMSKMDFEGPRRKEGKMGCMEAGVGICKCIPGRNLRKKIVLDLYVGRTCCSDLMVSFRKSIILLVVPVQLFVHSICSLLTKKNVN